MFGLLELTAGREELAAITGLHTGRVRLGAMTALGPLDLPSALARFHREHPGIEITLSEDSTTRMAQRVLDGQLDLAIAALDVAIPDGVSTRVLLDEPVLVALPRSHTLAGEPAVEVGRLRDDPYVLFRSGTGLRTITAPQVRALPLSPPHTDRRTPVPSRSLAVPRHPRAA